MSALAGLTDTKNLRPSNLGHLVGLKNAKNVGPYTQAATPGPYMHADPAATAGENGIIYHKKKHT